MITFLARKGKQDNYIAPFMTGLVTDVTFGQRSKSEKQRVRSGTGRICFWEEALTSTEAQTWGEWPGLSIERQPVCLKGCAQSGGCGVRG